MTDDRLERRLRTLYQVELVDSDPPLGALRERIDQIPRRRRWALPGLRVRRLAPAFIAVALPLSALVGFALLAGSRAPLGEPQGLIAFTQSRYGCGDAACVRSDDRPGIDGLRAEMPTISTLAGDGTVTSSIVGVPGTRFPLGVWSAKDARNGILAGPAARWSPDGTRIAFRLFNDVPGIYVANRDGSSLRRLVELPADRGTGTGMSAALTWSPDGTRIAYTYPYRGLQTPLFVVNTADGSVTELGVNATRTVAWSPDGTRLAVARSDERNATPTTNITRLFVLTADGSDELRLVAAEADDHHVDAIAWSPDGSRIAFTLVNDARASGPNLAGIYTIRPDGRELVRIAGPENDDASRGGCCIHMSSDAPLAWSPDGLQVAARGTDLGGSGIVVASADGSGSTVIGSQPAYHLDWSPDGSRLVYAVAVADATDVAAGEPIPTDEWSTIHVINVDGTGDHQVAIGEYPDWSR